jgi:hypothetical protein
MGVPAADAYTCFDVPLQIKCAIMVHIYPIKFIAYSKLAVFCALYRHTHHEYHPACQPIRVLKILKIFICDTSYKVIIGLNSISYDVFVWTAFISTIINRRCP